MQHAIWLLLAQRKHFALSPQAKAESSSKKRRGSVTDPAANANNLPQFLPLSLPLLLSLSLSALHSYALRNCGKAAGNQQAFMDATTRAASASPDELVDDHLPRVGELALPLVICRCGPRCVLKAF